MGSTTTTSVRIANFPIDANGMWGRIDGTIAAEAKVLRFVGSRQQMVEVELVNPPLPYQDREVLALDVLLDGTFGPAELI